MLTKGRQRAGRDGREMGLVNGGLPAYKRPSSHGMTGRFVSIGDSSRHRKNALLVAQSTAQELRYHANAPTDRRFNRTPRSVGEEGRSRRCLGYSCARG
jgi:hypothetical protein